MKIESIALYQIKLEFKKPFSASWGSFSERYPTIVEIKSEGLSAFAEAAALPYPYYGHEDSQSVFHVLSEYLCPMMIKVQPQNVDELRGILDRIKLNNIAKSGLEMAFWDLIAKKQQMPLYKLLGGSNTEIKCGATLSSDLSLVETLERVSELKEAGYKKIRLKISRSSRLDDLQKIFSVAGNDMLALDANGCFSLLDLPFLKELDQLKALYLEQPLPAEDLISHAELQAELETPVCLDECIYSAKQAEIAARLKSADVFSLKSARLAGHAELLEAVSVAQVNKIRLVAGGMFESGIGRAHALAVASLSCFAFPAALSESRYYYAKDIVQPEFSLSQPGVISLADLPGIGVEPDLEHIKRILVRQAEFS